MSHDDTTTGPVDTTDEMRQMATKAGGGVINCTININPPQHSEREILEQLRTDPCALRGHRPAYRVDGGIECYDCGARYA